jgi:hypothetical protein
MKNYDFHINLLEPVTPAPQSHALPNGQTTLVAGAFSELMKRVPTVYRRYETGGRAPCRHLVIRRCSRSTPGSG